MATSTAVTWKLSLLVEFVVFFFGGGAGAELVGVYFLPG